jgi:hypothetical protein
MRLRPSLAVFLVIACASACILDSDSLPGQTCRSATDCPMDYACVPGLADGGMTCELAFPLGFDAGMFDAGYRDAGQNVDAGMDSGVGISFSTSIQPIFDDNCIACHAGATPPAGLDLSTSNSWGNLVNVPCACDAGVLRVKPDDLSSMLLLKTSDAPGLCGASMPKGQMPLSQSSPAQFQQLQEWVAQGALQN